MSFGIAAQAASEKLLGTALKFGQFIQQLGVQGLVIVAC